MIKSPFSDKDFLRQIAFFLNNRESYQRLIFHTVVVLIEKNIITFRTDEICKKALFSPLGKRPLDPMFLFLIYHLLCCRLYGEFMN